MMIELSLPVFIVVCIIIMFVLIFFIMYLFHPEHDAERRKYRLYMNLPSYIAKVELMSMNKWLKHTEKVMEENQA